MKILPTAFVTTRGNVEYLDPVPGRKIPQRTGSQRLVEWNRDMFERHNIEQKKIGEQQPPRPFAEGLEEETK